jgi:hypothetical protein
LNGLLSQPADRLWLRLRLGPCDRKDIFFDGDLPERSDSLLVGELGSRFGRRLPLGQLDSRLGRRLPLGQLHSRLGPLLHLGELEGRLFGNPGFLGPIRLRLRGRAPPQEPPTPAGLGVTLLGQGRHVGRGPLGRSLDRWGFRSRADLSRWLGHLGRLGLLRGLGDIDELWEHNRRQGSDDG